MTLMVCILADDERRQQGHGWSADNGWSGARSTWSCVVFGRTADWRPQLTVNAAHCNRQLTRCWSTSSQMIRTAKEHLGGTETTDRAVRVDQVERCCRHAASAAHAHDRIPEAESVPAADWLTSAAALLRCYTDLCRPEQERHDQLRRRAQNGAQPISRWLVASCGHELEHACTIALLPVLQLLYILQCPTAVPRVTHEPMLLPRNLPLGGSRCACVAQVARAIAVESNALLDDGSANGMAGEHHHSTR